MSTIWNTKEKCLPKSKNTKKFHTFDNKTCMVRQYEIDGMQGMLSRIWHGQHTNWKINIDKTKKWHISYGCTVISIKMRIAIYFGFYWIRMVSNLKCNIQWEQQNTRTWRKWSHLKRKNVKWVEHSGSVLTAQIQLYWG